MISQMPMPDTAKIDAEAGASRNGSRRPTVDGGSLHIT